MGQVEGTSLAHLEERYFRQKVKLGQGSFGTVWRAVDRKSGEPVAVKELTKANRRDVLQEIALMKACRHDNVLQFLGFFEDSERLFLALEYCDSGDFGDKIRQLGLEMSERQAASWVRQMCEAVNVLHSQGICHRDIKPDNFMVHNRTELKLADFGMAVQLQKGQLLQTVCGTRAFLPPETSPLATKSAGYGLPVDMWALGVSMYMVMFGGKHPFLGDDGKLDEQRMLQGSMDFRDRSSAPGFLGFQGPGGLGLRFSHAARRLCRRLVDVDPSWRLAAGEAVEESWLYDDWCSEGSSSASSSSSASPAKKGATPERRSASTVDMRRLPTPGRSRAGSAAVLLSL